MTATPPRPGLGRIQHHDPRNLAYAHGVLPKSAIQSVAWARRTPILDQGQLGSCTGNALTGLLGTDSAGRTATSQVTVAADGKGIFKAGAYPLDEDFAVMAYELNTRLDNIRGQYKPDDTGSSGPACGKTAKALGLASGYTHAFSYDALRSALQSGPVLIGIPWYNSMFNPEDDGRIPVDAKSGLAGGHELLVREYDAPNDRVWADNSWGLSWGVKGRGYLNGADLRALLSDGGDVTVLAFTTGPVPTPPPSPAPATDPRLARAAALVQEANGLMQALVHDTKTGEARTEQRGETQ
jgi:hypothetical protein